MGSGVFSKVFRYACLAAIALAAAFLAAVYTTNPASAKEGDDNADSLKNWDSDNLRCCHDRYGFDGGAGSRHGGPRLHC